MSSECGTKRGIRHASTKGANHGGRTIRAVKAAHDKEGEKNHWANRKEGKYCGMARITEICSMFVLGIL